MFIIILINGDALNNNVERNKNNAEYKLCYNRYFKQCFNYAHEKSNLCPQCFEDIELVLFKFKFPNSLQT